MTSADISLPHIAQRTAVSTGNINKGEVFLVSEDRCTGVGSGGGKGGKCPPTFLIGGAMVCLCPPTFNPTFLFST